MAASYHPSQTFGGKLSVNPEINVADLLAHACEPLASANVMALDLVNQLGGTGRNTLLGIAQIILLRDLTANRALGQLAPTESPRLCDERHTAYRRSFANLMAFIGKATASSVFPTSSLCRRGMGTMPPPEQGADKAEGRVSTTGNR